MDETKNMCAHMKSARARPERLWTTSSLAAIPLVATRLP
jgi:hypothetical protein